MEKFLLESSISNKTYNFDTIAAVVKRIAQIKRNKKEISLGIGIVLIFLFTRLYGLKYLPIFIDEAIYSRFAQMGTYDTSLRFVSLVDGKQPLFIWLTSLTMGIIKNPLVAGRVVSIVSGVLSLIGLFFLSVELFKNKWIAFTSVIFYTLLPFALILNRMALYDSLVGTFYIWSLYISILLVRYLRTDLAFLLGMVIGGGLLTKTSNVFSIYLLPSTLLLLHTTRKKLTKNVTTWILLAFLSICLSLLYYSVLYLSPLFYQISEKNAIFVYHVRELIPYKAFFAWPKNALEIAKWITTYFSMPSVLLLLLSFYLPSYRKEKLLLIIWSFIPLIVVSLFTRLLYPRHIFFLSLPLILLVSFTLVFLYSFFRSKIFYWLVFFISFVFMIFTDYKILTDFSHAPIPAIDSTQYINGITAGGGMREVTEYLLAQSKTHAIFVVADGTYGSFPKTVLEIYSANNPNISLIGLEPIPNTIPKQLRVESKNKDVYIVLNNTQRKLSWPVSLILEKRKGISDSYLRLYKVNNTL